MGLTTAQVGRLAGYSTQQVRDLERLHVLPPVRRDPNGYRRYEQHHVLALRAYRALAAATGPVAARRVVPALVAGTLEHAAAIVDGLHADLADERRRVGDALAGLDAVLAERPAIFDDRDAMTIGELAEALGLRPSTLRHWEHEGLVSPDRTAAGVRRYGIAAIAAARIVAALRGGGYRIPPIRSLLQQLHESGGTADARRMLDERLADLTRRSVALLAASAELYELLSLQRAPTTEGNPPRP